MSSDRRKFLRNITLGTGALVSGMPAWANENAANSTESGFIPKRTSGFNMCGYAAPKLDKVRIGFVGLGMRGPGAVERMSFIEGVEIAALCDKFPDRVASAQKILEKAGLPKAKEFT